MNKVRDNILLFFLFSYAVYCALIVGQAWDEPSHFAQGKITLEYLLSLGRIDNDIIYRENYSSIYWTLQFFLTKIFPAKYQIEGYHLINLIFTFGIIFGIGKLSQILFNKTVGKITFLILFFYPIFFGHLAFNNKDLILAFSHVWISYLIFKYLKNHNNKKKTNQYVILIGVLSALGMGIQLVFLGSLIPIFLFIICEIFIFKKLIGQNFNKKKFSYDILKCFLSFYILLIIFWIDAHSNVLVQPFNIILETFSDKFWTGWPYNLVNGNYYLSNEITKFYFLTNFIYKTPEYILFSYLIFFILFIKYLSFFRNKFNLFTYKISLIILILIFPNLLSLIVPYPVYDGMRLFLWTIPYFCIIPGLTVYFLIENYKSLKIKIVTSFLFILSILSLYNFFTLTPYQYTYLNLFNGKKDIRYKNFEGDYWSVSIKELIKKSNFEKQKKIHFAACGIDHNFVKNYLKKYGYNNIVFVTLDNADYIVMTNRVVKDEKVMDNKLQLTNCFDKYDGTNVVEVSRNGGLLSVIRKLK